MNQPKIMLKPVYKYRSLMDCILRRPMVLIEDIPGNWREATRRNESWVIQKTVESLRGTRVLPATKDQALKQIANGEVTRLDILIDDYHCELCDVDAVEWAKDRIENGDEIDKIGRRHAEKIRECASIRNERERNDKKQFIREVVREILKSPEALKFAKLMRGEKE